jgi:dTDP-4-dehydrorhamnose 3,5-epimerase
MKVEPTALPEVLLITPQFFEDARGFFMETWNAAKFADAGIEAKFVQDNHSSSARGILRGLHYQLKRPQGKLVRVTAGRVFDVAVDLRRGSPRFGQWSGVELSADNRQMLWIPPGFAHGFLALEDATTFLYKCTDFYSPADERCVRWDDPGLAIDWPVAGLVPTLSPKDARGAAWNDAETYP